MPVGVLEGGPLGGKMTLGMLDGTPVGPVAVPVPALTDEATMIEPGSHDVAVLVPVGTIDWGAGVVGVTVTGLIEAVVESVEREVGLVRETVPLEEALKLVVMNEVGLVTVAFEETVAGPVKLIVVVVVVGKAVAVVLVEAVIGGVVVSVPKILERMLPRPVEDADEDDTEIVGMIPPRIEDSTFPPPLVDEVMVGSDEEEVVDPVGSTVGRVKVGRVKVGRVKLSPSRPPPLEDEVVIVASLALVVVVVVVVVDAPEDVPGPNNPLKRSLRRLSSLEVVGVGVVVVVVVVVVVSEVTTPPGPKVMAELWPVLAVDIELDLVVECVLECVLELVLDDVGWTMTGGMIAPEPVGLSRSDRTSVPPNGNPNKPLNPSRARLGETGLAGVALLTTRLIWRGK